ncbi:UDP-2,3-diacylglucosamine diphosphatase [Ichthyobacterium seriolicida]|uniref:UDP-2,3-diacylglucosamine diphosphatase n=1 Tax=Ichthyobacterium seriolicida TaxID=242600 RepID=UPI00293705EF|nr:UDP-2,3-diacylglucosamine diphosphatase [Ichthyobacterium seriolicida]
MCNNKVYFASDQHFGIPNRKESLKREKIFVGWLDSIKKDAQVLFLLGDMFDFWFEYKHVIPKGFTRVLGKLAELSDSGIRIYFFAGNHDFWMCSFFEKELNISIFNSEKEIHINNNSFFIAHGDGLGTKSKKYKIIRKLLHSRICQSLFYLIHPDLSFRIANYFSNRNKNKYCKSENVFTGEDREELILFSREKLKEKHFDYFVFGHRHMALEFKLSEKSTYFNTGDWVKDYTYLVFDGKEVVLKKIEV